MFKWTSYAFIRFTFFFILGICYGLYKPQANIILWQSLFYTSCIAYCLFGVVFRSLQAWKYTSVSGIAAASLLFCFGVVRTYQANEANLPQHLLHQPDSITHYRAIVKTPIQQKTKNYRTILRVYQVKVKGHWRPTKGNLLLYIRRDSITPPPKLQYGNLVLVSGTPMKVAPPKNPKQFNYQSYLARQNIYHQHFTTSLHYQQLDGDEGHLVWMVAYKLRHYLDLRLKALVKGSQEYGIATALLLGVKEHIENDIKGAYSSAGLMHLLAVSGLHVGFIYLIFHWLFKPLRFVSGGKVLYTLNIIACLWLYAFVTGLSASVLRAVAMFTVITIAKASNRRTNIYNTLAVSAFALLLYDPLMFTSVGFQLSYIAVLGIVYIQPKIYRWLRFSHWLPDYLWQLTSVSIAAQLATFPLAVYYFHQFPNYFLLSNLLALPLAPALLLLGISTLLLSFVPVLGEILGYLLRTLIETLNMVIVELSKLPLAASKGIYLHQAELWLVYFSLCCFLLVFHHKRFVYLKLSAIGVLLVVGLQFYYAHKCQQQEELAIFYLNKYPHVQFTQGTKSVFIAQPALQYDSKTLGFNIDSYLWSKGVKQRFFLDEGQNQQNKEMGFTYRKKNKYALLLWKNKSFLILQEFLRYRELKMLKNIKTDYLVIQNKAIWSLTKLCEFITPQHIIIDDSNGFYRGRKLYQEAQKAGIRTTWISQNGAFILRK